jgi:hypothetical protein
MGKLGVVWIINLELQDGRPRLCRLRTTSVGTECTRFDYVLAHTGFPGVPKLSPQDLIMYWHS